MSATENSPAWRTFLIIVGMAAGVAVVAWSTWYAAISSSLIVIVSGGLVVAYCLGSYAVIRKGAFRKGLVAQFVVLSVSALMGMWLLGAIVALMLWEGPLGPPN